MMIPEIQFNDKISYMFINTVTLQRGKMNLFHEEKTEETPLSAPRAHASKMTTKHLNENSYHDTFSVRM